MAFKSLQGKKLLEVRNRAKFLCFFFEKELVMAIHLRMSGRILVRKFDDPEERFERTRIEFENLSLRFVDQRKFGRVWVSTLKEYEEMSGISLLGPTLLEPQTTFEVFYNRMRSRGGTIKQNLLNQAVVSGVGNIYADEGCFYAGLRPHRSIKSLKKRDFQIFYKGLVKALNQGIFNRGTSIADYRDAFGKGGKNQEMLFVYRRGGQECKKCQSVLVGMRHAGRGTVFCKVCQR